MSNFKSEPVPTDDSVELTVWSADGSNSIEIITDVVPKTLRFINSYLATKFPTNKLDIVVVPSAVITSTENPGLIVIKCVFNDYTETNHVESRVTRVMFDAYHVRRISEIQF